MTDNTSLESIPVTASEPLPLPPEVEALFDEASDPNGRYAASPTASTLRLIEVGTGTVVREVQWPEAGRWARNFLRNALGALPEDGSPAPSNVQHSIPSPTQATQS